MYKLYMSCKTETKHLTVKFIYSSRILNINDGIIVCKDDSINKLYSDINNNLLINHKNDDKIIYFYLFCNTKLCSLELAKTFDEVFDISPYVINVVLTKEFFNKENLLTEPSIKTPSLETPASKEKISLPKGLEEISKHEFFEDIEKGHLQKKIIHLHGSLLGIFLKIKVEEDHLLVKIANSYLESLGRKDMITENIVTLLTEEINNKEIQIGDKKYLLYYLREFSIKQLKALLPKNEKTTKFLKDYLVKNEEYGCKINHPSCQFEKKFREILDASEDSFKKFIDFIDDKYNLESFMNMSFFHKYLDKAQKLLFRSYYKEADSVDKFSKRLSETMRQPTLLAGGAIGDKLNNQTGGDVANFNHVRRLLEISGEPLHDFANKPILNQVGPEKQTKIVAFWLKEHVINKNRENLGTATGEIDCWKELGGIFKSKQIFIDTAGGINSGNHEDRYLKKIMDNSEFHLTDNVIVKDRFKFYKYDDSVNFMEKVGKSGVSQEYKDIFVYIKALLREDGINHLLYDQGKLSELRNYLGEGVEEESVNTITTATKLWDPSPGSVDKHIADLETYKGDPVFQRTLQSLFMSNSVDVNDIKACPLATDEDAEDAEYSIMSELFKEERKAWTPIREDLRNYYSITYNFDTANKYMKNEQKQDTILTLTLKDSPPEGVNISGGLSINDLIVILYFTENKQAFKDKNDVELKKELKKYKLDNIPNNALEAAVYILKNFWTEDLWRDDEKFHIRRRILLDMKKSGDWGLVNWVRLNNKCNSENHKTILFSGDRLCGLMGMCSDIPVLSNGSAVAEMVEWESTNTFLYYTGTSPPVTSVDLTAKVANSHTLLQEILGKNHQFKDEYKMLLTHHSNIKMKFTEANALFSGDTENDDNLNNAKSLQILFAEVVDIIIRLINVPDLSDTKIGDTTQNIYELLVNYTMGYNHIGLLKQGEINNMVREEVNTALSKLTDGSVKMYEDRDVVRETYHSDKANRELLNLLTDEYEKLLTMGSSSQCFINTTKSVMGDNFTQSLLDKGAPGALQQATEQRKQLFMNDLSSIISLLTSGSSPNYNKIFVDFPRKLNDLIEDINNLPNIKIYDTTLLKISLIEITNKRKQEFLEIVEKDNSGESCDGESCINIQDNFKKIRKIYNCIYDAFITEYPPTEEEDDSGVAEFYKTIEDNSEYMRILLGLVNRQEQYSEDESKTEYKYTAVIPEIAPDSPGDVESLQIRSIVSSKYYVPVNVGDVLAILTGPSHETESVIVGLGQVISIKLGEEIEHIVDDEKKLTFIMFKVLTPYKQIDTGEVIEKDSELEYEYINFKHTGQKIAKQINLNDSNTVKVYNSDSPVSTIEEEHTKLVIILGNEGDRKAGICVIKKYIKKTDTHCVIVLTKFEADVKEYGELGAGYELDVNSSDIELITPEDILSEEFILEPARRE